MELIKRVEIAYFRSIYKERLDKLRGTNVIFGRNDSGKSNVLRALNLFFNGETNPGLPFNLDRDFCHGRLGDADTTRELRKFVYVKVWFATPKSWQPSLGQEFWVKKQWSVTRQSDPHETSSIEVGRHQMYLTRFLNRVRFHYIPAIKDRRIFEHLLGQIYSVVARQEEFATSLGDFAGALRERTDDLTEGLRAALGLDSVISPPDDLTDLFRSLDFETNTEHGDSYSLTLQRGDGIQVRHIPAILAFLSDRGVRDYHVWGFEEPENSLELANAIGEAQRFREYGRTTNKQVFLTSHSPAFFSLEEADVARFFVSRSERRGSRLTSKLLPISGADNEGPSELMGDTPHLPVVSSYLREAHEKIQRLRAHGDELARELGDRARPLVFVEGESDAIVMGAAWDVLIGGDPPFDWEACGGTTKMESLGKDGRVINRLAPERPVLVVVDNDAAARALYKNGRLDRGGTWVNHGSNGSRWCRLPISPELDAFLKEIGIPRSDWPGSLENLFPPTLRDEALQAGALALTPTPHAELLVPANYRKITGYLPPTVAQERHFVLTVEPDTKVPFAHWVAEEAKARPDILESLRPVVEGIRDALEQGIQA